MQQEPFTNDPRHWLAQFPWPAREGHKYDRGHTLVVGGPMIRAGAAKLSANAALRAGAGLVSIVCDEKDALAYAASALSVMTMLRSDWDDCLKNERITTLVIGPGAGITERTRTDVLTSLAAKKKLVIDADAITAFAGQPNSLFSAIKTACILTPHAGEFNAFSRPFAMDQEMTRQRRRHSFHMPSSFTKALKRSLPRRKEGSALTAMLRRTLPLPAQEMYFQVSAQDCFRREWSHFPRPARRYGSMDKRRIYMGRA